jgi:transposase
MFAQGVAPAQVARRLRVSWKSAYAWCACGCEGGSGALRSKGPSGCPSRMRPEWCQGLDAALEEGPAAHGWAEDQRWTLARVATVIARRFHVRFSLRQVSWILHERGWSVQVPVHRAAERDEEAVEGWVREVPVEGGKTVRRQGAWLVFVGEAGQRLRPPKARTWSRRGRPPVVKVTGKGSGRVSPAALVCVRPGGRTRLIYRLLEHPGRKGGRKGFREDGFTPPAGCRASAARREARTAVGQRHCAHRHRDAAAAPGPPRLADRLSVPPLRTGVESGGRGVGTPEEVPGQPGHVHHQPTRRTGPQPAEEDAVPS